MTSVARSSISPVGSFGFSVPAGAARPRPRRVTTNSLRTRLATAWAVRRVRPVDDDLGDPVPVAEVEEDQLAVVPPAMDPAGQAGLAARVGRAQLRRRCGSGRAWRGSGSGRSWPAYGIEAGPVDPGERPRTSHARDARPRRSNRPARSASVVREHVPSNSAGRRATSRSIADRRRRRHGPVSDGVLVWCPKSWKNALSTFSIGQVVDARGPRGSARRPSRSSARRLRRRSDRERTSRLIDARRRARSRLEEAADQLDPAASHRRGGRSWRRGAAFAASCRRGVVREPVERRAPTSQRIGARDRQWQGERPSPGRTLLASSAMTCRAASTKSRPSDRLPSRPSRVRRARGPPRSTRPCRHPMSTHATPSGHEPGHEQARDAPPTDVDSYRRRLQRSPDGPLVAASCLPRETRKGRSSPRRAARDDRSSSMKRRPRRRRRASMTIAEVPGLDRRAEGVVDDPRTSGYRLDCRLDRLPISKMDRPTIQAVMRGAG